jgi:protein-tyrosine-phosphatase
MNSQLLPQTPNKKPHSVLFVCTGNLHRSPMAEYFFQAKIGNTPGWQISSAGTYTRDGMACPREVMVVLRKYGISAKSHRSREISRQIIEQHQLVLCLASNHKEALRAEFPDLASRIYLLSEMVGKKENVDDPIGGPLVEFESVAREIDAYLTQGFDQIVKLSTET